MVVLLIATACGLVPILLSSMSDASVRYQVDRASATERDIQAHSPFLPQFQSLGEDLPEDGTAVWEPFIETIQQTRDTAAEPLPGMMGEPEIVGSVGPLPVLENFTTEGLTLVFAPGLRDNVRLVEGDYPAPVTRAADGSYVAEVMLSTSTAKQMNLGVGTVRTIRLEPVEYRVLVSGLFEAHDQLDDYWSHLTSTIDPLVFDDGNQDRKLTGTAVANPATAATAGLLDGIGRSRPHTAVWFPFDQTKVSASNATQTVSALAKLSAGSTKVGDPGQIGIVDLRFSTSILERIRTAVRQQESVNSVVALLIAGPAVVGGAVLVLGCRLLTERRKPTLEVLSARGASSAQLRSLLIAEGLLAGLPASVVSVAVVWSWAVFSNTSVDIRGIVIAIFFGVAPAIVLAVTVPSRTGGRERWESTSTVTRRRAVFEGLIIGVAVVANGLLIWRGYSAGADPLLALAPILLSLALCTLTLRLYPYPLRMLVERARTRPGISSFVGTTRALREPVLGATPVLALMVGLSVAVSSTVLMATLQTGVEHAARARIGTDARVTAATITNDQLEAVRQLDAVSLATGISEGRPAKIRTGDAEQPVSVYVVDADVLREVQGSGPGLLPANIADLAAGPEVPILVSSRVSQGLGGDAPVQIDGTPVRIAAVVRGPVPVGTRENWAVIDSSAAERVLGGTPTTKVILIRLANARDPVGADQALREILGENVSIEFSTQLIEDLNSAPAIAGMSWLLLIAVIVSGGLSVIAVTVTSVLAGPGRSRTVSVLHALGSPRRVGWSLLAWDLGPPSAAALIVGTASGAVIPVLLLSAVDLRPFTGSTIAPAYQFDGVAVSLTVAAFAVAAGLASIAAVVATANGSSRVRPTID